MTKVCSMCKKKRDKTFFSFRNKKENIKHKHCKLCQKKASDKHYRDNKSKYKEKAVKWCKENVSRRRAIAKEYSGRNRAYVYCDCCDRDQLIGFYEAAPKGYHVDHILRLARGGAHCISNMQYLTASEHGVKSCGEYWHGK